MVKDVKGVLAVESSGFEVGIDLPQIGIYLVCPLVFEHRSKPSGHINILEMCIWDWFDPHGLLDTESIHRMGQSPNFMVLGNLLY